MSGAERPLRINFVLPPCPTPNGGSLAVLRTARRLLDRGHTTSITTYGPASWQGPRPFPWFDFPGPILFRDETARRTIVLDAIRSVVELLLGTSERGWLLRKLRLGAQVGWLRSERSFAELLLVMSGHPDHPLWINAGALARELLHALEALAVMPDCDLNVATWWTTAFPTYFSAKGRPVFFMQHYEAALYPHDVQHMLGRVLVEATYALPMHKVVNSSWLQQQVALRFQQDVPLSPNGVDLAVYRPTPKRSARDGIVRVVTFARPDPWKGFAEAVAAMGVLQKEHARLEWHVFGPGHPSFAPHGPEAPYHFHGNLTPEALAALYADSDVVLCPSHFESFPLPPLEAMACGTAVITTRGGTEDYARHESNALVVQPRDVGGMIDALRRLLRDVDLRARLAAEGRRTAEGFGWEAMIDRREAIFRSIAQGEAMCDAAARSRLDVLVGDGPCPQAAAGRSPA